MLECKLGNTLGSEEKKLTTPSTYARLFQNQGGGDLFQQSDAF